MREEWKLKTGGYMDDVDLEVVAAKFGYRPSYAEGTVLLLIWTIECPEFPEAQEILFSVGKESSKEWEAGNGGEKAIYVGTGQPTFRHNSTIGQLTKRVIEIAPGFDERGLPSEAHIWAGTRWHVMRERLEFGGGLEAKEHLMPVAYLGEKKAKAVPKVSGNLEAELVKLAKAHDFDSFQVKALAAIRSAKLGKPEADAIRADVLDDSEQGFWARHHHES